MSRAFLDTNVFVYALGREHPYRDACREIVERLRRGEVRGEVSVEIIQELLHVRGRRAGGAYSEAAARAREVMRMASAVHAVEERDLRRGLELLERHGTLRPSDAIHAATALNRGIEVIVTADRHFDAIEGLRRVDPLDADALGALGGPR